jgi:predicted amidohydrolase
MAQAKARHPDWPDRFFNVGFVIDPDGAVILQHHKISALLPCERSVSPHDVFDWWVEKYGRTLQAFWPVADTAIGRLGVMMAMEGNYPENGRGLALNGAEVVYRASLPPLLLRTISLRFPTGRARWKTTCTSSRPT